MSILRKVLRKGTHVALSKKWHCHLGDFKKIACPMSHFFDSSCRMSL